MLQQMVDVFEKVATGGSSEQDSRVRVLTAKPTLTPCGESRKAG